MDQPGSQKSGVAEGIHRASWFHSAQICERHPWSSLGPHTLGEMKASSGLPGTTWHKQLKDTDGPAWVLTAWAS